MKSDVLQNLSTGSGPINPMGRGIKEEQIDDDSSPTHHDDTPIKSLITELEMKEKLYEQWKSHQESLKKRDQSSQYPPGFSFPNSLNQSSTTRTSPVVRNNPISSSLPSISKRPSHSKTVAFPSPERAISTEFHNHCHLRGKTCQKALLRMLTDTLKTNAVPVSHENMG